MDIIETIKEQVESNGILLYMKGSPNQPQCGFSARTVEALMACGERFAYVDILSNRKYVHTCRNTPTGRHFPSCGWLVSWWAVAIS